MEYEGFFLGRLNLVSSILIRPRPCGNNGAHRQISWEYVIRAQCRALLNRRRYMEAPVHAFNFHIPRWRRECSGCVQNKYAEIKLLMHDKIRVELLTPILFAKFFSFRISCGVSKMCAKTHSISCCYNHLATGEGVLYLVSFLSCIIIFCIYGKNNLFIILWYEWASTMKPNFQAILIKIDRALSHNRKRHTI